MCIVEIEYKGKNISIQIQRETKFEEIFKKFEEKIGIEKISLLFLYSGNIITNYQLTFDQVANNIDKERNKMNILAVEIESDINKKNESFLGESYSILDPFIDQKNLTIYETANVITSNNIYKNSTETDYTTNITDSPIYLPTVYNENIGTQTSEWPIYTTTISDISLNNENFLESTNYDKITAPNTLINTTNIQETPIYITTTPDIKINSNSKPELSTYFKAITDSSNNMTNMQEAQIYTTTKNDKSNNIIYIQESPIYITMPGSSEISTKLNKINEDNFRFLSPTIPDSGSIEQKVLESPIYNTSISEPSISSQNINTFMKETKTIKGYNTIQNQEGFFKSAGPNFQYCRKSRNNINNNYPVIRPNIEITPIMSSIQKPLNGFNYPISTKQKNNNNNYSIIAPIEMSNLSISSNPKPFPGCNCPKCSKLRNNINYSKNISSVETTTSFNLSNQKPFTASETNSSRFKKSRNNNDYLNNFPKNRRNTFNSAIQRPFPGCNCQKCRNLRNN